MVNESSASRPVRSSDRPADRPRDRVAIVTGASRGIGRALANGLAAEGYAVVCTARSRSASHTGLPGTIDATVEAIAAAGGEAMGLRCDVGDADDLHAMIDATMSRYGRIDTLVNNAMESHPTLFDDADLDGWDRSFVVNVRSLFITSKLVVPIMAAQGGGSIINISSGAAAHDIGPHLPPGYLIYSTVKAAMERFTTALAPEVAARNIAVNALRVGPVKTELSTHELGEDYDWTGWQEPEVEIPPVLALAGARPPATGRILRSSEVGKTWT